ncbi:MAG: cupin domain-containing protein [Ardenticatenales bacterium]|nr:cupin domain-containing protein [Ardenticatenales bacterium]
MIPKANARESTLPWQSDAYHVAARYKELDTLWEGEGVQVQYVEVEAGGRILPHTRKTTELLYCLTGEGRFTLDKEEIAISSGDCFVAPRHRVQGVSNQGGAPLHLLIIQLPDERQHLAARLFGLFSRGPS